MSFKLDGVDYPRPGYGAMGSSAFYGETNLEQAKTTLRKAIEIGCTVWNTADFYGFGANEELIGSVLKDKALRDKVFVITKFGGRWGERIEGVKIDASPEYAAQAIDASIGRLGFTPDAWIVVRISKETAIEDTVAAMEKARQEGKTKYIGLGECSAATLLRASKVAKIDFIEVEYSPWTLDMEDNGVLKTAADLGVIVLAYSPLGRGFLTGRYKRPEDFETGDFRTALPRFQKEVWDQNYKIVESMERLAKAKGCIPGQLSLAWLMAQGPNIVPIPGTKSENYLIENFASREVVLTEGDLKEIREVIESHRPSQPRWMEEGMHSLDV